MGRLRNTTLERIERFADRVLDVAETLQKQRRFGRVVDQIAGSGTSAGANLFEADQAMTTKDFAKSLGVVRKELNETKFWLRLIGRRAWIKKSRLDALLLEAEELLCIFNAMVVRTGRRLAAGNRTPATA